MLLFNRNAANNITCNLVYRVLNKSRISLTWPTVHTQLANYGVRNVFRLLDLILCFPATYVANECTFSAMKFCKGKRRGRMKTTTLNDLLTIQLQFKYVQDFDLDKAIKLWMVSLFSDSWDLLINHIHVYQMELVNCYSHTYVDSIYHINQYGMGGGVN